MRKILKYIFFVLILSTFIIPILPVSAKPKTAQAGDVVFKDGYAANDPARWDPPHYQPRVNEYQ